MPASHFLSSWTLLDRPIFEVTKQFVQKTTGPWPKQLVVPRAVTIADAIAAINCTINFTVSFLLIVLIF